MPIAGITRQRRFVIVWGAHAPSRAGSGASPEPLVVASLKIFGGGAEDSTRARALPRLSYPCR